MVLLAIAFGTISTYKQVEIDTVFTEFVDNYLTESPIAANQNSFVSFTNTFVEYVRTKDPYFGIVAVHAEETITVVNALGEQIIINNQYTLAHNRSVTLNTTNTIDVVFGSYTFSIPVRNRTISALFASRSPDAIRLSVKVS